MPLTLCSMTMSTAIRLNFARHYEMAIRRSRLDRKTNLTIDSGNVVDLAPGWEFSITCPHHGEIYLDFRPHCDNGRVELVSHIRDAFWSMRHELVGITLAVYYESVVRTFFRFLDELSDLGQTVTHLHQIDRKLIDQFLAWLELQLVKRSGRPWSVISKRKVYGHVKSVLVNRQKRAPEAVSPLLTFPQNPYPNANKQAPKRQSYSAAEHKRIVAALHKDLVVIHGGGTHRLTPLQIMAVHIVSLALATGRNMQPLLDLRRDSLREHPLADREILVTTKRRGWSTHSTSVRKAGTNHDQTPSMQAIPASVGDHFRFVCNFTASLSADAADHDREYVFLRRQISAGTRAGQIVRITGLVANQAVKQFGLRHKIVDDSDQPLSLNVARLRPTFATELYRRTRDIRRVQQALGHASAETTARHYIDTSMEAVRDHALVVDGMVSHFTRIDVAGKVLLAADGGIPLHSVQDLLSGGYNTGIARCKNPFRDGDSVCKKFFACFKCPSMCVFEDDLWRLFSFYYRLLSERSKMNPGHWVKTYGPILRRIDVDIAPQFSDVLVEAAKERARVNPHPTWKGGVL
ncbi:site-specific integrase [Burkholderia arboris]|uniref:tyrosine-type recombinase/integrase n=1 Tax=Burkholderia arboris TaxID=488730 RepID=UPI001CF5FCDC|nr:tyrosine-type recombinase/integrase [Burkholderia arboris]MCA8038047.1 site-specific integrase [Burkholderia arboris]